MLIIQLGHREPTNSLDWLAWSNHRHLLSVLVLALLKKQLVHHQLLLQIECALSVTAVCVPDSHASLKVRILLVLSHTNLILLGNIWPEAYRRPSGFCNSINRLFLKIDRREMFFFLISLKHLLSCSREASYCVWQRRMCFLTLIFDLCLHHRFVLEPAFQTWTPSLWCSISVCHNIAFRQQGVVCRIIQCHAMGRFYGSDRGCCIMRVCSLRRCLPIFLEMLLGFFDLHALPKSLTSCLVDQLYFIIDDLSPLGPAQKFRVVFLKNRGDRSWKKGWFFGLELQGTCCHTYSELVLRIDVMQVRLRVWDGHSCLVRT